MTNIRSLTKEEAFSILNTVDFSAMINHGSSRAVYDCLYAGKKCVIKIGLDDGGHNQNVLECSVYERFGDSGKLAEIYARFGNVFLVCEKVEVISYDFAETVLEWGEDADADVILWEEDGERVIPLWEHINFSSEEECQTLIDKMRDVYCLLEDIQGSTSDNEQLGINENGDVVAYDYGYDTEFHYNVLVGRIYNYIRDDAVKSEVFNQVTDYDGPETVAELKGEIHEEDN
jgi:hypothetical protein